MRIEEEAREWWNNELDDCAREDFLIKYNKKNFSFVEIYINILNQRKELEEEIERMRNNYF